MGEKKEGFSWTADQWYHKLIFAEVMPKMNQASADNNTALHYYWVRILYRNTVFVLSETERGKIKDDLDEVRDSLNLLRAKAASVQEQRTKALTQQEMFDKLEEAEIKIVLGLHAAGIILRRFKITNSVLGEIDGEAR